MTKPLNELSVGDTVLLHRDWDRQAGWVTATVERVTRTQITVGGSVYRIQSNLPHFAYRRNNVYTSSVQTFDQSVLDKQEEAIRERSAKVERDQRAQDVLSRLAKVLDRYSGGSKDFAIQRVEALVASLGPSEVVKQVSEPSKTTKDAT